MNIEAASQIADALSFILVTPEFLRDETLTSIRQGLRSIANKIASSYVYPLNNANAPDPGLAVLLLIFGGVGFTFFWLINRYIWSEVVPRYVPYFFMFICALQAASGLAIIFLFLTAQLLFRRLFFTIGAILFFATRTTLLWTSLSAAH
jgi:drug/metabolite transporter (DMT)-like permease